MNKEDLKFKTKKLLQERNSAIKKIYKNGKVINGV